MKFIKKITQKIEERQIKLNKEFTQAIKDKKFDQDSFMAIMVFMTIFIMTTALIDSTLWYLSITGLSFVVTQIFFNGSVYQKITKK